MLKDKILNTGYFLDNEYLDAYLDLISKNTESRRVKGKTQRHHIIPREYFVLNKISVDNSTENLVNLLYKDHILAHYYLALCCSDAILRIGMTSAVNMMLHAAKSRTICPVNIGDLLKDLDKYQQLHEELSKFRAEKTKEVHTGRKRSINTRNKISKALTGKQASATARANMSAAKKGRKMSEEQKSKISQKLKGRKQPWAGRKQSAEEIESRRLKLLGHPVSEETRSKISSALKKIGHKPPSSAIERSIQIRKGKPSWNKGLPSNIKDRICIYNPENQLLKYVRAEDLKNYIEQGWQPGNPHVSNRRRGQKGTNNCSVRCIETGVIFESIKAASEWCHGSVINVLNGISKTAGGYHWERVSPPSVTFGQPKKKQVPKV